MHADQLDVRDTVRERLSWFLHFLNHGLDATCEHFAISQATFRRWAKRFDPRDLSTLEEHSRRPHTLRESDIEPRVIEIIRQYRKKHTTMCKERIAEMLQEDHGITLSPSSVGRIIRKHRMYFANTLLHRRKLRAERHGENDTTSPSSLAPSLSLLLLIGAVAGCLLGASTVKAETMTSSSFQLTTDFPNLGEERTHTSSSFQLRGDLTWSEKPPLVSPSFQIVTDPPAAAAAAAPPQDAQDVGAAQLGGGGRRFLPPLPPHREPEPQPIPPPDTPSRLQPARPKRPAAPVVPPPSGELPLASVAGGLPSVPREIEPTTLRFFGAVEPACPEGSEERAVYAPVTHQAPPQTPKNMWQWMVLFIAGVVVGYLLRQQSEYQNPQGKRPPQSTIRKKKRQSRRV